MGLLISAPGTRFPRGGPGARLAAAPSPSRSLRSCRWSQRTTSTSGPPARVGAGQDASAFPSPRRWKRLRGPVTSQSRRSRVPSAPINREAIQFKVLLHTFSTLATNFFIFWQAAVRRTCSLAFAFKCVESVNKTRPPTILWFIARRTISSKISWKIFVSLKGVDDSSKL